MSDNSNLKAAATYAAQDIAKFADENEEMRALQQFHEEVDPETVLALIAENERLAGCDKAYAEAREKARGIQSKMDALVAESGQLKAENEALKKRIADMSPFKGAPLSGPDLKCLACGGYHYGMQGLPCPNMRITASAAMGKGEGHEQ